MDSTLYDYFLNGHGKSLSLKQSRAIEKELRQKTFPIIPDVSNRYLAVSFPAQTGYARYDIETSPDRLLVGRAYAFEKQQGEHRTGIITILLLPSPITVIFDGLFVPQTLEVWCEQVMIGKVTQTSKVTFKLFSGKGDADLLLNDDTVFLNKDAQSMQFGLQLNLNHIPFLTPREKQPSHDSLVYDPNLSQCNPLIVMAFLISLRMVYRRADF